jgi:hypothetical protein
MVREMVGRKIVITNLGTWDGFCEVCTCITGMALYMAAP